MNWNEWFDTPYLENRGRMLRTGEAILKNRHIAEELVDEVFLTLWVKKQTLYAHPNGAQIQALQCRCL